MKAINVRRKDVKMNYHDVRVMLKILRMMTMKMMMTIQFNSFI
jgi:hypothetical protein